MLVGLIVCCAAGLFAAWKTRRPGAVRLCAMLLLPSALLMAVVLNPVTAHFTVAKFHESEVQRFLWMVPMTQILAVCAVLVLGRIRSEKLRAGVFALVCCGVLLYTGGFTQLRANWQERTDNWYKVPQVVVELCDRILQDDAPRKTAVFPLPLNLWVRQYSPEIQLPFAWIHQEKTEEAQAMYTLYGEYSDDPVDLDELGRLARQGGYTYIVLAAQGNYTGDLGKNGYQELCRVDAYPEREDFAYYQTYILYREE